jgi:hypothetical protein
LITHGYATINIIIKKNTKGSLDYDEYITLDEK